VALHAYQLKFTDMKGNRIGSEAELPKDLKATIQQLEKWKKTKSVSREKN
jgi:23S rRNA pseudouridine955/2504/2580 synthase/23S rRNA pseudouridine1911/1915/1917 synthase